MSRNPTMIPDKQGRLIDIHSCAGGWKITPFQRDSIYQQFLTQFPSKDYTSEHALAWMKLQAIEVGLSKSRVQAFIREAVECERGEIDRSWGWWVGCSTGK